MKLEEKLDIIVLGATGFTGNFVVKKLALLTKEAEYCDLKWGIAGRSIEKLKNLLDELEQYNANASQLPAIECDVTDGATILQAARSAKILVNCTGPYSLYGEPVVEACVQTGTHYVDISAELHHMLKIYQKFHKAAEEAKVLIITACGFGSIPGVMGLMHLEKHFEGTLETVECYTEIQIPKRAYLPGCNKCLVHYGTWASLVHELKNHKEYSVMKQKTFPEPIYGPEPEEFKKSFFHRNDGRCWFPYPGPDSDIVDMTQRYLHKENKSKPVHFKMYTSLPLFIHYIILVPAFFCLYLLSVFKCFRYLLWKYPRFFTLGYMSHKGPTETMLNDTKYSFVFTGKGFENGHTEQTKQTKIKSLKVSGADPYKTTATACVLSAVTILRESAVMLKGGVVTSGAAFYNSQLVEKLNSHDINFEFI